MFRAIPKNHNTLNADQIGSYTDFIVNEVRKDATVVQLAEFEEQAPIAPQPKKVRLLYYRVLTLLQSRQGTNILSHS